MIKEIQKLIDYETQWIGYLEKEHYNIQNLASKTEDAGDENYNIFSHLIETKYTNFFRTGTKYNACKASWCTLFQGAALCECFGEEKAHEITGIPRNSYAAVVTYWRNYAKAIGRLYSHPAVGSYVIFGDQHIGLVVNVINDTTFETIEGNTNPQKDGTQCATVVANGGGVWRKKYTLNSTMKFCLPLWNLLNSTYVDPVTVLTTGDCNVAVRDLQAKLKELGYYTIAIDGDFGDGTLQAVKKFQQKNGLMVDGLVGKATMEKLNSLTGTTETSKASKTSSSTSVRNYLIKGDVGDKVKALQTNLQALGYNCGGIDGAWGVTTTSAVGQFQSDHGLVADYEWGSQSEQELQKCLSLINKYKFGVDLSAHQGCYNINNLCSAGGTFTILRGGYTSKNGSKYIDTRYVENYNNAKNAKLKVGVYYYSLAKSVKEAENEAEFLYKNCLKGKKFELPIYIDIEDLEVLKLGKSKVTEISNAFVNYLSSMGYVAGVYSSYSMFKSYFDLSNITGEVWVAQWNQTLPAINNMGMWQFGGETNKIRSNKINNIVIDQDFMIKDYSYIKTKKLNGFGTIKEKVPEVKLATKVPKVEKGDVSAATAAIQGALKYKGYSCGEVDGSFGTQTETQLKKFQADNKLISNGVCSSTTWEALLD